MRGLATLVAMVALAFATSATSTVRITVLYQDGVIPFPRVLVIARSAASGEVFRGLTAPDGRTAAFQAPVGPIEIIATCPYDTCATTVADLFVPNHAVEYSMKVGVISSDRYGTVIAPKQAVKLLGPHGKPLLGTSFYVRDAAAHHYKTYRTDEHGTAVIENPGPGWVAVVSLGERVYDLQLPPCATSDRRNRCAAGVITLPQTPD